MDEKLNRLDNGVLGVAVLTDRCSDTGSYSRSASAELISSHYKLTLFIVCVLLVPFVWNRPSQKLVVQFSDDETVATSMFHTTGDGPTHST